MNNRLLSNKAVRNILIFIFVFFVIQVFRYVEVFAIAIPDFDFTDNPENVASALQMLFLISIITLAPSLLIMLTCFPRIIISLHFLRAAMGTQQMPPNQVLVGFALFLTIFQMSGVFSDVYNNALQPFSQGQLTQEEAFTRGMEPIREFMALNAAEGDIALFMALAGAEDIDEEMDVPTSVLIPAFLLSEVKAGFRAGFFIYIPFIIVDMVVASILMSMGMMMLPPAMISLPFKILIFISADGWTHFISSIMRAIR